MKIKKLLKKTLLMAAGLFVGANFAWADATIVYERGTTNAWTNDDVSALEWVAVDANTGTTVTEGTSGSLAVINNNSSSSSAGAYVTKSISTTADRLITITATWNPGNATGNNNNTNAYIQFGDIKCVYYGSGNANANVVIGGNTTTLTKGTGLRDKDWTITLTINQKAAQVDYTISLNGSTYKGTGTTATANGSFNSIVFGHGGKRSSWANTTTLKKIEVSEAEYINVAVNAKYGQTVLQTEYFVGETGSTVYYGWPKYILKDGILYNNQQRNAGKQYTASATADAIVNNDYSVVSLGTGQTVEYYNELGSGVTQGGGNANYVRASHGNTTSVSASSSTEGKASLTVAAAGILPAGKYTFELGNYKNRSSIIKVGDRKVGNTATGANGGTYVVTTLNDVIVFEGEAVSVINKGGTSATEEIDYFLAIRTGDASVAATIGSTGYTTFASSYPLNISGMTASTGTVKAYYVTASDVKSSSVALTDLTGNVAAGTGMILEGTAGATITIPVVASGTDYTSTNMLVGCTADFDITTSTENYENFYVLSATTAAFKKIESWVASNTLTIPAGKAYLDTTGAGVVGAPSLTFDFGGEVTGIGATLVNSEKVNSEVFDLQGRKVMNPAKGLYIVNGRKVVIK